MEINNEVVVGIVPLMLAIVITRSNVSIIVVIILAFFSLDLFLVWSPANSHLSLVFVACLERVLLSHATAVAVLAASFLLSSLFLRCGSIFLHSLVAPFWLWLGFDDICFHHDPIRDHDHDHVCASSDSCCN